MYMHFIEAGDFHNQAWKSHCLLRGREFVNKLFRTANYKFSGLNIFCKYHAHSLKDRTTIIAEYL